MFPVDDDEALLLGAMLPLPPLPVEPARFTLDGGNGCLVVDDEYVGTAAG